MNSALARGLACAAEQVHRVTLRERMQDGTLSVSQAVLNLCAVLPGAVTEDSITWTAGIWMTKKQAQQTGFPGDAPDAVRRWWRERVDRGGDYAVHSTRPELQTAFVIRRYSGEVYPILADGSGGGLNQSQLEQLNLVVDTYIKVLGIAGLGGISAGIVAQFAKTLV